MSNVQNVEKVYSVDNKIWVGMKTKDANTTSEDMELFNFADKNGNGEIDESELNRYNGPLLVENFPENTSRIIGHAGPWQMNGLVIKDNEVDYYPGLTIDQVDKAGRVVFNKIDTNHDNVISKEEIEAAVYAKDKVDKAEEKLNGIQTTRSTLSGLGVCAGLAGGFFFTAATDALSVGEFFASLVGKSKCGSRGKSGWLAIGMVALFGGLALINRCVAKNKAKKEMAALNDVNHAYVNDRKAALSDIV